MKYYFKTPSELRDSLEKKADKKARKRNRGRMIFVLDLAIIVLIFGILYYFGFLNKKEISVIQNIQFNSFEFSAILPEAKSEQSETNFLLNVKNLGKNSLLFPQENKDSPWAHIEFQTDGILLHSERVRIEPISIKPGDTAIITLRVNLPESKRKKDNIFLSSIRLEVHGKVLTLQFRPRAWK